MKKGNKTFMAKPVELPAKKWYLIDADGKVLGRLATKVAMILMGKDRPEYTPHLDLGDHVVIINSKKVKIKGTNKPQQRIYQRYTGYTAGLKEMTLQEMLDKKPNDVIKEAVRRMLPKTNLGRDMLKKLRVYSGATHTQIAQTPEVLEV